MPWTQHKARKTTHNKQKVHITSPHLHDYVSNNQYPLITVSHGKDKIYSQSNPKEILCQNNKWRKSEQLQIHARTRRQRDNQGYKNYQYRWRDTAFLGEAYWWWLMMMILRIWRRRVPEINVNGVTIIMTIRGTIMIVLIWRRRVQKKDDAKEIFDEKQIKETK